MQAFIANTFTVGVDDGNLIYLEDRKFEDIKSMYPFLLNMRTFYLITEGQYGTGELHGFALDLESAHKACENAEGKKYRYFVNVRNQKLHGKNTNKPKFNQKVRRG